MKRKNDINAIIVENDRRRRAICVDYDPLRGIGAIGSRSFVPELDAWLPDEMIDDPSFSPAMSHEAYCRLRFRYDFEFWTATCVSIRDKLTGRDVRFHLNAPQRRVLQTLEADRHAGRPIRIIMLKARQWGGSTLIQVYMAWIQCIHRRNWHSLVCAHVRDTAATIRGMYSHILDEYPSDLWPEDEDGNADVKPEFRNFERSQNVRFLSSRGSRVTLASAERPESARGQDIAMAHLSEVAFWPASPQRDAVDFARAICSGIPMEPYTLIALESTANGVGGYFHSEWLRAEAHESDKHAVFVPWYEIDFYRRPVADTQTLWDSLDEYCRRLWQADERVTLEALAWYQLKRREYQTHRAMMAEYPSNSVEAFATTGNSVFDADYVNQMRLGCSDPAFVGEVVGLSPRGGDALRSLRFVSDSTGRLSVWHLPEGKPRHNKYVVTVDVGGRSEKSDWSVIAVMERRRGAVPRVVAQWRGHIDHDLLAWKAAAIAKFYQNALLVVESNTLESESEYDTLYILEEINSCYRNVYRRRVRESVNGEYLTKIGFHTNRATKALVITELIAAVRDSGYEETDIRACNEFDTYQVSPSGAYAARPGCHDDILMTRAISLYVIATLRAISSDEDIDSVEVTPSW